MESKNRLPSQVRMKWIRWVNHYYMKGKTIWQCSPQAKDSWYWRKLLKVRDMLQCGVDHTTGKWIHNSNGSYGAKDGYELIRTKASRVDWFSIVRHQYKIPKCAFILWLALQKRLLTKDRLSRFGMTVDDLCVLCEAVAESHEHLFFECTFTTVCAEVLQEILADSKVSSNGGSGKMLSCNLGVIKGLMP